MANLYLSIINLTNEQLDETESKVQTFLQSEAGFNNPTIEVSTDDAEYDDEGDKE